MYRPKRIFHHITSGVVLDSVAEVLPALQESFFRPATWSALSPATEFTSDTKIKGNSQKLENSTYARKAQVWSSCTQHSPNQKSNTVTMVSTLVSYPAIVLD